MPDLPNIIKKAEDQYAKGNRNKAIQYYQQAANIDPNCAEALEWLGELHVQDNKLNEAVKFYEKAQKLNPNFKEYANLGYCYYELSKPKKSVTALLKAIEIDNNDETSHSNLGKALYDYYVKVDKDEAHKMAKQWRQKFANNKDAFHMGAALSNDIPPPPIAAKDFVREIFDDFAEDFDRKLAELEYEVPSMLVSLAAEYSNSNVKQILDLGCGTGLAGVHLQAWLATIGAEAELSGIDLSPKMLEHAHQRNLYQHLYTAEITTWLKSGEGKAYPEISKRAKTGENSEGSGVGEEMGEREGFDVILAADVFCYFGDLQQAIQAASERLAVGGLLLFSLETAPDGEFVASGLPYRLNISGRYQHRQDYPETLAHANGLHWLEGRTAVLRSEYANPVFGILAIMQKI